MKWKIIAYFSMLILILFGASFLIKGQSEVPTARNGVLDLSTSTFEQQEPFPLDGEWEFVSGQLVDMDYFRHRENPTFVKIPSLWVKYHQNNKSIPKYTDATYRLVVKLPENQDILGIKTGNIRMANAIYIDGKKIGQSGIPKEDETYSPRNTPYISFFQPKDDEIEIIVHVANYDYASGGGIISSLYLGDEESILKMRQEALTYDWIMIAAFFVVGIYFLGFFLHFTKDRSLLYLALFCFSAVLYTTTHGEKVLDNVIPNIPYSIFVKLQGSSNLIMLFLLAYFHNTLRSYSYEKIVKVLISIGVFLSLSVLLPLKISSHLQMVYSLYLFVVVLYISFIQIRAIQKRTIGATYLLIGSGTLILYCVVGTLNVMGNTKIDSLPPIFPFIYLLMLSLFMANRFTNTYRKNAELNQKLLEVAQFKDEFLTKTSHEFKTPLHGMITILQTMLDKKENAQENQEEKLHFVISKAKRLASLVNDILDIARIKRKDLHMELRPIDLYSTVYLVLEVFSYILNKNIKIINQISNNTPFIIADENRLRQILYNLIDNAIKYTFEGEIVISAYERNGEVVLSVKDTGIGIAEEQIATIFDDYERGDNLQENRNGLGLGLSITKQLIKLQGGDIWVESQLGVGTTFSFSLPMVSKKGMTSEKVGTQIVESLQLPLIYGNPVGKKIIIADDNHANLRVLMEALDTSKYKIFAVDNGQDVLNMLEKEHDIGLLILDIMMPNMNGYEVCQIVRERFSLTELPVLMLTAGILSEDMMTSFQAGANDFLNKPVDLQELQTRVNNLLLIKESARSATNMEIAFLQAQIKPHFIYNVLSAIISLSYMDIEQSRKMTLQFSTFLRQSFDFTNTHKLIPLKKELALVESYVEIEKVRFPERFLFHVDIVDDFDCFIPPLTIQPIIENAIRHGMSGENILGEVTLNIDKQDNQLIIIIHDNGIGMNEKQVEEIISGKFNNQKGVGLLNIVKRINHYQGGTFSIESNQQGTMVKMTFPFIVQLENEDKNVKSIIN